MAGWKQTGMTMTTLVVAVGCGSALAAGSINPRDIPGLTIWLDAADSSTLFADLDGTRKAEPGTTVARWEDKSGQENHSTQPEKSLRPSSGEDHGRPSVLFSRSTLNLDALGEVIIGDGFTLFLAIRPDLRKQKIFGVAGGGKASKTPVPGEPYVDRYLMIHRDSGKGPRYRGKSDGEKRWVLQYHTDKWEKLYATHVLTGDWVILEIVAGNGEVSVLANGTPAGTARADSREHPYTGAILGAGYAKRSAGNTFFEGAMGEVMAFQGTLDDETQAAITDYLMQKWQSR